jgi:hypothetical protein
MLCFARHFLTSPIIFRVKQQNTSFMFCEAFLALPTSFGLKQQNTNVIFSEAFFGLAPHHLG